MEVGVPADLQSKGDPPCNSCHKAEYKRVAGKSCLLRRNIVLSDCPQFRSKISETIHAPARREPMEPQLEYSLTIRR